MHHVLNLKPKTYPHVKNGFYSMKQISQIFSRKYKCIACGKYFRKESSDQDIADHIIHVHPRIFEISSVENTQRPKLNNQTSINFQYSQPMIYHTSSSSDFLKQITPSIQNEPIDMNQLYFLFNKGGKLIDLIEEMCIKIRFGSQFSKSYKLVDSNFKLTNIEHQLLNKTLKNLEFQVDHFPIGTRFQISNITALSVSQVLIKSRLENGVESLVSVKKNFEMTNPFYFDANRPCLLPYLPCVLVESIFQIDPLLFPFEVVSILGGQYSTGRSLNETSTVQQQFNFRSESNHTISNSTKYDQVRRSDYQPKVVKTTFYGSINCNVCGRSEYTNDDEILLCKVCNIPAHISCYGISYSKSWKCDKCLLATNQYDVRCELCPEKKGTFQRTNCGKLAHVVCALYIPEARFEKSSKGKQIVQSDIPIERFYETCSICLENDRKSNSRIGACIKCYDSKCQVHFHVTCAQANGLLCEQRKNIDFHAYCDRHRKEVEKNVKFLPKLELHKKCKKRGHKKSKNLSPLRSRKSPTSTRLPDSTIRTPDPAQNDISSCDSSSNKKHREIRFTDKTNRRSHNESLSSRVEVINRSEKPELESSKSESNKYEVDFKKRSLGQSDSYETFKRRRIRSKYSSSESSSDWSSDENSEKVREEAISATLTEPPSPPESERNRLVNKQIQNGKEQNQIINEMNKSVSEKNQSNQSDSHSSGSNDLHIKDFQLNENEFSSDQNQINNKQKICSMDLKNLKNPNYESNTSSEYFSPFDFNLNKVKIERNSLEDFTEYLNKDDLFSNDSSSQKSTGDDLVSRSTSESINGLLDRSNGLTNGTPCIINEEFIPSSISSNEKLLESNNYHANKSDPEMEGKKLIISFPKLSLKFRKEYTQIISDNNENIHHKKMNEPTFGMPTLKLKFASDYDQIIRTSMTNPPE